MAARRSFLRMTFGGCGLLLSAPAVALAKLPGRGGRGATAPGAGTVTGRRIATLGPLPSPCGRHRFEIAGGVVRVDGRRVPSESGAAVELLSRPTWRRDGSAVAWIERDRGAAGAAARLIVLPAIGPQAEPLPWALPAVVPGDQVFWAGRARVVVGPALLAPKAIASWT